MITRKLRIASAAMLVSVLSFAGFIAAQQPELQAPPAEPSRSDLDLPATNEAPANPAPAPSQSQSQEVQHYRAKQILGSKVSLNGEVSASTVDDIVFDDFGRVAYLIVRNNEGKLVTVPWDAANFSIERRVATIHIAPEQFQAVPTYTPEKYPVFTAPTYRTEVYRYYGIQVPRDDDDRRSLRRRLFGGRDRDRD